MKYIFKEAIFGDSFKTKSGKIAKFLTFSHELYYCYIAIEHGFIITRHNSTGECEDDSEYNVISRYQEPIDEDKLDQLVDNTTVYNVGDGYLILRSSQDERYSLAELDMVYKAGYRDGVNHKTINIKQQ